jgi:L-ascorbate metabolism protein UlaG (beta-lactamase superfamily)
MRGTRWIPLLLLYLLAPPMPPAASRQDAPRASEGESAAGQVRITYVGNEGFLIAAGGRKILVDALYREGVQGYVVLPERRRALLEGARPPFDKVDLVLATHHHADHLDPRAVGAHLRANPRAVFVSTAQAVERLRTGFEGFGAVRDRVRGVSPAEGERVRREVNGIPLEIMFLHHGRNRPIENLGFLFRIGGRMMLHVGDTEATPADLARQNLPADAIDVAFLPFWFLLGEEWPGAVRSVIRPRRIAVMHVPPRGARDPFIRSLGGRERMLSAIESAFPEALVFRDEMDVQTLD